MHRYAMRLTSHGKQILTFSSLINSPSQKYASTTTLSATPALSTEDCQDYTIIEPAGKTADNGVLVYNTLDQGCTDYLKGWAWQHLLLQDRMRQRRGIKSGIDKTIVNDNDVLLMLQHDPVYTLGRGADEEYLTFLENNENAKDIKNKLARRGKIPGLKTAHLAVDRTFPLETCTRDELVSHVESNTCPISAPNGVPIYRVERGGEVTYHGPGQLVVYPLLDLTRPPFQQDLHWMLRMMEEVVIKTLEHYDIHGNRDDINSGVWVGQNKVCAVGIAASRWITTHGLAININPNMDYFDTSVILPCGVNGRGVTSMAELMQPRQQSVPCIKDVAQVFLEEFKNVFQVELSIQE